MQLQQAQRKNVKIKLGLQGSSGSGKTFSALLIGFGITNDWSKIAVIDTENHSAELYSHLGTYNVLNLISPFSPERYIEAIEVCLKAQMEVIIIDSISHEWDYIIEQHGALGGNSYTNWSKFTPRHQKFIQAILQANVHIICTLRAKQDYVLNEKNGKQVPEKVGMKAIQKEGLDYELTIVFEIDIKHNALATKDRTGLFENKPEFKINSETGQRILEWCREGIEIEIASIPISSLIEHINACSTVDELRELYMNSTSEEQTNFRNQFNTRKQQLQTPVNLSPNNQTFSSNGTSNRF
ncbi:AAA family ATPase [Emticicia agri]|uniref:AAA family ATPase n=1 Tax=Emticicia agri TaxID=2492393 RepID=A0A4Q5LR14_9BACT|nr:AAA family ATPase [Emticicia agri]RYU91799.1 AAA family ATPase [Emticicia agri]